MEGVFPHRKIDVDIYNYHISLKIYNTNPGGLRCEFIWNKHCIEVDRSLVNWIYSIIEFQCW